MRPFIALLPVRLLTNALTIASWHRRLPRIIIRRKFMRASVCRGAGTGSVARVHAWRVRRLSALETSVRSVRLVDLICVGGHFESR
jgi:hypothetical protein